MRANLRNKHTRMLAKEVQKLADLLPALLTRFGFVRSGTPTCYEWHGLSTKYNCEYTVRPQLDNDGHPWLACEFKRPYARTDLSHNAPENYEKYADVYRDLGANRFTGKHNCRIFERVTAQQALDEFEWHLRLVSPDAPKAAARAFVRK